MTGASPNGARTDVGRVRTAPPTEALTKSAIDGNVFLYLFISPEGRINGGAGFVLEIYCSQLAGVLQDPDYKSAAGVQVRSELRCRRGAPPHHVGPARQVGHDRSLTHPFTRHDKKKMCVCD